MALRYPALALEFVFNYYIIKKILNQSLKPKRIDFLFWFFHLTFSIISEFDSFSIPGSIICKIITMLFIYSCTKTSVRNIILIFSIYHLILMLIQALITACIGFFNLAFTEWYIYYIGNAGTLLLAILLFQIPFMPKIYDFIWYGSKLYQLLIINFSLFWLGFLILDKLQGSTYHIGYYEPYINSIFVLVIFLANLFLIYYEDRLKKTELKLEAYQTNLPVYDTLISEIRANQHEYSNRLQSLQNLPRVYHDYDSLVNALQTYTDGYNQQSLNAYPLLCINMPLLAASLYHLSAIAEQKDIIVSFDIETNTITSYATEYELRDYTSVILQNAVEACSEGDHIYVHMSCKDGKLHYEVRNPSRLKYSYEEIARFFKKDYSTKEKQPDTSPSPVPHGYGLHMVQKKVTTQGGYIGCDSIEDQDIYWTCFRLII